MATKPKWFQFSLGIVCRHPLPFLIATLLIALFFMSFLPFVRALENIDFLFVKGRPEVKFYDDFKKVFGNDEFFVIAFEKEDIFTKRNLSLIKTITDELEALEEIREVKSLANVSDTIGGPDSFEVRNFLESIPDDKKEREQLKKRALNDRLYAKNLISPDGRTAAIVVRVYDRPSDEDYRKNLINKVELILSRYKTEAGKFYLAGWTVTNLSLAQYMKNDLAKFIPITFLIITIAVFFFFKNVRLTLLALANTAVCTGTTVGLMGMTGVTMNNVTAIIPPLLMAYSLSDTTHIFSFMEKRVLEEFPDKAKALASILKRQALPCFLSSLTTAVGFASLITCELPPVREFGLIGAVGLMLEFMFSFFFLPPLILLFAPDKLYAEHKNRKGMNNFFGRLADFVLKHHKALLGACCAVFLLSIWLATKVQVETNPIEYFRKNTPVRKSLAFVEDRLGGLDSFDISLKASEEDAFKEPSNLKVIEKVQDYIKTLKGVDVTTSFADFIKKMNQSFHNEDQQYYHVPESRKLISQYLLLYDSNDIENFINSTYDQARIAVRISEHGSTEQKHLIAQAKRFVENLEHPDLDVRVTGWAIKNVSTIDAMVKGQIDSLTVAVVIIFIIMVLALRSFAMGGLSIIPNIFPILLNFGFMGAFGIPLTTATAMIAAVAIGIAVDDTIHFLTEYKRRRAEKIPVPDAVKLVITVKGLGMMSSSLIIAIGFVVLLVSNFVPIIQFGILCAIIMITDLIGNFILLPSIILLKSNYSGRHRGAKAQGHKEK